VFTAVGCVLALTLSACGSDTQSASSSGATNSASQSVSGSAQPAPTGTPIKIGVLVDQSGPPAAEYKESAGVATAWAKWANETQGGVNGHPVELIVTDVQGQPGVAAQAARQMVADGAVAVVAESSVAGGAVEPYLDEQKIPLLTLNDGTVAPDAPSTVFTVDMGYPNEAKAAAVLAKVAGKDSIMSVVCAEFPACTGIGQILADYAPTIGVAYKGTMSLAIDATSATAQCLQITEANPGMVATFLVVQPITKLASTCQTQGYPGPYAIYANRQANLDLLTPPTYGVLLDFPWWSDAAPVVEYRDAMATYGPDVDYKGYIASNMWALLQLFNVAMTKSGPAAAAAVTGADVITAYRTGVKDETLDGLLPQPITYAESGNTEIDCFWSIQYEGDGKFTTLSGAGASGNGATGDLASSCLE